MGKAPSSKPGIRNLQFIKGGSYTITVPRWWVEKHSIEKGAKLFLVEDGVSLRLAPMKVMGEMKRAEVQLETLADLRSVKYFLWTYYMQGADEMTVTSRKTMTNDVKKVLREIRLDLPDIEITNEDSHTVTFTVLLRQEPKALDDLIAQFQKLATSIYRDAVDSVVHGNLELASEVVGRENEVLRNYRAIIRRLAICSMNSQLAYASGIKDSREMITYALLIRDLNQTVYHSISIAKHFVRMGKPLDKKSLPMLQEMSDAAYSMQKLAIEGFIEKNYSKVLRVLELMKGVRRLDDSISIQALKKSKDTIKAVTETLIAREIRRVAGYSVGMADAAANRILSPSGTMVAPRGAAETVSPMLK